LKARVARARQPVGNYLAEFGRGDAGMGGGDPFLAGGRQRFRVPFQQRLEGLFRLPFRVLRRHDLDTVDGEGKLGIERLLTPQRTVIVERGDALRNRHKIRAALCRYARYKVDHRFLRRTVVPGQQGIGLCKRRRCGDKQRHRGSGTEKQRATQHNVSLNACRPAFLPADPTHQRYLAPPGRPAAFICAIFAFTSSMI
jgi:hypothetical protein